MMATVIGAAMVTAWVRSSVPTHIPESISCTVVSSSARLTISCYSYFAYFLSPPHRRVAATSRGNAENGRRRMMPPSLSRVRLPVARECPRMSRSSKSRACQEPNVTRRRGTFDCCWKTRGALSSCEVLTYCDGNTIHVI
jgi:hypothetical protein